MTDSLTGSDRRYPLLRVGGRKGAVTILAVGLGLLAGCFPSARLVASTADPGVRKRLSGQNPGASSINRIMGKRAAAVVLVLDVLKGYLPATAGRYLGVGPVVVEALALAPMTGHIVALGGRGGAALAGGVVAVDPLAFMLLLPVWVGATIRRDNARGALAACLLYPGLRWSLGRSNESAAISCLAPVFLIYARLRGPGWSSRPLSPPLLWRRLIYDAELQQAGGLPERRR